MTVASLEAVDRGIPRRLSARPDDRYFDQGMVARLTDRVAVMLDGVELDIVTSYDVERGQIVRQRRDASGRSITDEHGEPLFETLRGAVEVRWHKGSAA